MDNTLVLKKIKDNKTIYLIFMIIYIVASIISFVGLMIAIGGWFEDMYSSVGVLLMFLNYTRVVLAFVISLVGLIQTSNCIINTNYIDSYLKRNSIWKGFVISALISPFFLIMYINTYRIAQLYCLANQSSESAKSFKLLSKKLFVTLTTICAIVGSISTVGYSIAAFVVMNNTILRSVYYQDEVDDKDKDFLPDIRLYYDGNSTSVFDPDINFSVITEFRDTRNKKYNLDDKVKANTNIYAFPKDDEYDKYYNFERDYNSYSSYFDSVYSLELVSDKKTTISNMDIYGATIKYYPYEYRSEEKLDSAYITLNNMVINRNTDYNSVREMFKQVSAGQNTSDDHSSYKIRSNINEYESEYGKSIYMNNSYYSLSVMCNSKSNMVERIDIRIYSKV